MARSCIGVHLAAFFGVPGLSFLFIYCYIISHYYTTTLLSSPSSHFFPSSNISFAGIVANLAITSIFFSLLIFSSLLLISARILK